MPGAPPTRTPPLYRTAAPSGPWPDPDSRNGTMLLWTTAGSSRAARFVAAGSGGHLDQRRGGLRVGRQLQGGLAREGPALRTDRQAEQLARRRLDQQQERLLGAVQRHRLPAALVRLRRRADDAHHLGGEAAGPLPLRRPRQAPLQRRQVEAPAARRRQRGGGPG